MTNDQIRDAFAADGLGELVDVIDLEGTSNAEIHAKPGLALCDFCSDTNVVIGYITPAVEVLGSIQVPGRRYMSEPNWAACRGCMECIERKDRKALVDRAEAAIRKRRGAVPGLRGAVKQMHDAFWAVHEG